MSKPLLMSALLIYYVTISQKRHPLLITALIFALMGDQFLLFDHPMAFLLGLGSFLIMQFFYIILFTQQRDRWYTKENGMYIAGLVLLYGIMMAVLYPKAIDFEIPIVVYGLFLCGMVYTSLARRRITYGYSQIIIGAVLFLISDTLIGIEKFSYTNSYFPFLIMLTYIIAQFLIVDGQMKFEETMKVTA